MDTRDIFRVHLGYTARNQKPPLLILVGLDAPGSKATLKK